MASLSFRIKGKGEVVPILVRFRPSRDTEFSAVTPFTIKPENWDPTTGFPIEKKTSLLSLKSNLWKIKTSILEKFKVDSGKIRIDKAWLEDVISHKPETEIKRAGPSSDLVEYFDFFLSKNKPTLTLRSYQKYSVIKGNVIQYENLTGEKLKVSDVGFVFAEKYKIIMLAKGYSPNTVERSITFIKTVCRHANRHGLTLGKDFLEIKVQSHKVTWPYLSFAEIEAIEKAKYPHDYLQNAADWLVISCHTGQRVSDFMNFSNSALSKDINNDVSIKMLDIIQEKTGAQVYVPILPPVERILAKRNGDFPRAISDQKYNLYIKEVCKIAGLNEKISGTKRDPITGKNIEGVFHKYELISSHVGRRSFATNYYLRGNFDIKDIMEITGHTTEKSFLLYIGKKKKSGARGFYRSYLEQFGSL
ncbi:INTN1_C_like domain containing protein [Spirosomataceae bacterium]